MSLIKSFDTDENFWVANPQFKNIQPFKGLHNSDKSRNKATSSKTMWYVAQVVDTSKDNIFRNVPYDERISLLSIDFMNDADFYDKNEDLLEKLIKTYHLLHTTPALKAMEEWDEKMVQRAKFIKTTAYTMDKYEMDPAKGTMVKIPGNAKVLDDMMKNTAAIYNMYHQIMKSLAEEDEDQQVKGGQTLSLSDQGDI